MNPFSLQNDPSSDEQPFSEAQLPGLPEDVSATREVQTQGAEQIASLFKEPMTTPTGFAISRIQNEEQFRCAGAALDNSLGSPCFVASALTGNHAFFTFTDAAGNTTGALELSRDPNGTIEAKDGTRWKERQFKGPANTAPCSDTVTAKLHFLQALQAG